MAHIIPDVITKGATSTLAQADLSRALDVYRLALGGDNQCRRLWNDYAAGSPDMARLVIQWDQAEKSERATANAALDGLLIKAESGMPGKTSRRSKKELKSKRAAQPPRQSIRDMFKADLYSPDPVVRLTAERALRAR